MNGRAGLSAAQTRALAWPCDQVRAVRNAGQTYAIDKELWEAVRDWRLDQAAADLLIAESESLAG